jgi:hypothetical protein
MLFTDNYYRINDKDINNKNLIVKRILRIPLRIPLLNRVKWIRKMTLRFGNTVQCPSVTYNRNLIKGDIFTSELRYCLDWDTFYKIYGMKGIVRYIPLKLMSYRISDEATTKESIVNDTRYKEDNIMFKKMWPDFIVKMIMKKYTSSYNVYDNKNK